jgi:hypothetical protein
METYGRAEVEFNAFLTLELNGGEWSTSAPDALSPRKEAVVPIER